MILIYKNFGQIEAIFVYFCVPEQPAWWEICIFKTSN